MTAGVRGDAHEHVADAPGTGAVTFAVIGNGFGRQHLAWLAEADGARVELLCFRSDAGAAEETARRHGVARVSSSAADALTGDVDVVCVVTPVDTHVDLVRRALAGGSAVVCDKPLALTAADADALADLAAGTPSMVMFQWRFHPAVEALRALLGSGRLGVVVDVTASFDHDFLASPASRSPWRHDPARAGAGALADQGVHLLDLLMWTTGHDYRVRAAVARVVHGVRDDGSGPVGCRTEDAATVVLESPQDGHSAQVQVSRVSAGLRRIRVAVRGTGACAELEIDPETTSAVLAVTGDEPRRWPAGSLRNPYEAFLAARAGAPVPVPSFADAARAQALLDAATALLHHRSA